MNQLATDLERMNLNRSPNAGARQTDPDEPYIILAIDFGTTYSGVSWTWSGELENVRPIRRWPDALNGSNGTFTQAKVPTRLLFKNQGEQMEMFWGFDLEHGEDENQYMFEWFKVILDYESLDETVKNSPRVKRTHAKLARMHSEGSAIGAAVEMTTKYLTRLWKSAVQALVDEQGYDFLRGMPIKVMLTKPAIWSTLACKRTKKAARRAISENMGPFRCLLSLKLVSEPEAAARAVLASPTIAKRPDIVNLGDTFVVADCGGGTVDVISYRVTDLEPLRLEECVEGIGDLCGSIFIDDEFELFMRVQSRVPWDQVDSYWKKEVMSMQWNLESSDASLLQTKVGNDIEPLFHPACGKARVLIDQQVQRIEAKVGKVPKAIILVGGMGSSQYLGFQLREQYREQGIDIRQTNGDEPWTAVCRGAAMTAALQMDIGRISRYNYGFRYNGTFNPRIHNMSDAVWDDITKRRFAPTMDWIVRRGQVIRHLDPVVTQCTDLYRYPEEIASGIIRILIWHSPRENASERKDELVSELCEVACYLPGVFRERDQNLSRESQADRSAIMALFRSLPQYVNKQGIIYRQLDIDVIMSPQGRDLHFTARFDGRDLKTEMRWPGNRTRQQHVSIET